MIHVGELHALTLPTGADPELRDIRTQMRRAAGFGALDLGSLVRGAVKSATFRSNLTPPLTWDPSAPSAPDSPEGSSPDAGAILRATQPTLDVELQTGQRFVIAPGGEATGDYRVIVGGVVVAVVSSYLLALAIGYALGRRSRARRRG